MLSVNKLFGWRVEFTSIKKSLWVSWGLLSVEKEGGEVGVGAVWGGGSEGKGEGRREEKD